MLSFVIAGCSKVQTRAPFVMPKAEAAFTREQKLGYSTLGWHCINPVMQLRNTASIRCRKPRTTSLANAALHATARTHMHCAASSVPHAHGRVGSPTAAVQISNGSDSIIVDEDEHPAPEHQLEQLAKLKPLLARIAPSPQAMPPKRWCLCITTGVGRSAEHTPLATLSAHHQRGGGRSCSADHGHRTSAGDPQIANQDWAAPRRIHRIEINEAFAAQVLACT